MKTKTITLYEYNELSETAKEKALEEHNENNDFPFLEEHLNEALKEELQEHNIKALDETKLYYSLSYCQGDGLQFNGLFEYKNLTFLVEQQGHYNHKYDTIITTEEHDEDEDELKDDVKELIYDEFKELYYSICDKLEKEGYSIIEYENSEENFKELCEINEYTFKENGTIENL